MLVVVCVRVLGSRGHAEAEKCKTRLRAGPSECVELEAMGFESLEILKIER